MSFCSTQRGSPVDVKGSLAGLGLWSLSSDLWVLICPFIRAPYLSLSGLVCGSRLCKLSVRT